MLRQLLGILTFFSIFSVSVALVHAEPAKEKTPSSNKQTSEIKLIPAKSRAIAPEFELDDLNEELVALSDFKGKVVVVNFWATWCEPCKQEIPHLDRLLKKYQSQGLEIFTISTDNAQTQSQVEQYAKTWSTRTMIDTDGEVKSLLNPRGFAPYTLIVDRSGMIAFTHQGYNAGDETKIAEIIKALLAEKP